MSAAEKPKVAILGATFETNNMGVSALAAATVKCILEQYPEAEIFFLDYSKTRSVRTVPIKGKEISVALVNLRFSRKFYLPNNIAFLLLLALVLRLVPSAKVRGWLVSKNYCLSQIESATLFVSLAGGDSFSDIYGMGRLLYVALPQILVLWLRKRLVLLPQTIGPFRRRTSKAIAQHILRRAQCIYSRELRSFEQVEQLARCSTHPNKVAFSYDVAFVLDAIPSRDLKIDGFSTSDYAGRPTVGLNVSGLLYIGGYTGKNMFGLRANYPDLVARIVEHFVVRKNANVLLIPHVFGYDDESDEKVCQEIYEALKKKYEGRLRLLRGSYNQHEVKHAIGGCDFVIGSRMHACIAAVSQCVPAVCVSYSDKFIGVMESLGIESLVVDARTLGSDGILDALDCAYETKTVTRQRLIAKMPEVREKVLSLFARIDGRPAQSADQPEVDRISAGRK